MVFLFLFVWSLNRVWTFLFVTHYLHIHLALHFYRHLEQMPAQFLRVQRTTRRASAKWNGKADCTLCDGEFCSHQKHQIAHKASIFKSKLGVIAVSPDNKVPGKILGLAMKGKGTIFFYKNFLYADKWEVNSEFRERKPTLTSLSEPYNCGQVMEFSLNPSFL